MNASSALTCAQRALCLLAFDCLVVGEQNLMMKPLSSRYGVSVTRTALPEERHTANMSPGTALERMDHQAASCRPQALPSHGSRDAFRVGSPLPGRLVQVKH